MHGDYTPPARPPKPITRAELRRRRKAFENASQKISEIQEQEAQDKSVEKETAQKDLLDELDLL